MTRTPRDRRWLVVAFVALAAANAPFWTDRSVWPWVVQPAFQLALGAAALVVTRQAGRGSLRAGLGLMPSRLSVVARCAAVAGGVGLIWAFGSLLPNRDAGIAMPACADGVLCRGALFLTLVLFPAFFEELFFRGALQHRLESYIGVPAAALVCSILFAWLHADAGLHSALFAFAMGIALAAITIRSHSIQEAIVIHALNNLAVFVSLVS